MGILSADTSAAHVLVLGSMHTANPGRDAVNVTLDDVLAPTRQAELEDLANRLATFRPSKVCVERMPEDQAALDSAYASYPHAIEESDRSEVEQIGFRLARRCGLPRVHAIDADPQLDWDGLNSCLAANPAEARRLEEGVAAMQRDVDARADDTSRASLLELLRSWNTEEALRANLALYVDIAGIGGLGEHGGADYAASWYRRNLRIFSNLCALTEPGDRLFVLYGAGHVPILRHLVGLSPRHRLVDVDSFLGP